MKQATQEALEKVGALFSPDDLIRDLSVAQREQVAIAAALLLSPSLLILDEPTASLSNNDVERLFEIIRGLRDHGVTIIYISHHLDEVFQLVDRITVLRDGKLVSTMSIKSTSQAESFARWSGVISSTYIRRKSSRSASRCSKLRTCIKVTWFMAST